MPLKENELTMDGLKTLIQEGNKVAIAEFAKELREEMKTNAMKAIFPTAEDASFDNELKTFAGTVMDPQNLSKFCQTAKSGAFLDAESGAHKAGMFAVNNGLFNKVSPAVYKFGELLKNWKGMRNGMYSVKSYSDFIQKCDHSYGYKAATDMGSAGGILIPTEYPAIMIEAIWNSSELLSKVWRMNMSAETQKFPKLFQADGQYFGGMEITSMGGPSTGEGTALSHTKPTVEWLTFNAKKIGAVTALTEELMQDSVINILNYISGLYIRATMYAYERYIIAGNGIDEPLGITKDPTIINNAVLRQTKNTVSFEDPINVESSVDEIFRDENLMWLMRRATFGTLRKLKDTVGQPLIKESWSERNSTATQQPEFMGHARHMTRNVPAMGKTGDITIGDFSFYMFTTRQDMRIDVSDAPYWTTDQTAIRLISRIDGKPGASMAFKMLKESAS